MSISASHLSMYRDRNTAQSAQARPSTITAAGRMSCALE